MSDRAPSGRCPATNTSYPTFECYHDVSYNVTSVTGKPCPLSEFVDDSRLMALAHGDFIVFDVDSKHGFKLRNKNFATATQFATWILTTSKNFDEEGTTKAVVLSIKNFVIAFFIDTKSEAPSMEITLSKDANTAVCIRKENRRPDSDDVRTWLFSKIRPVDLSCLPEKTKEVFNDLFAQTGADHISHATSVASAPAPTTTLVAGGGSSTKKGKKHRSPAATALEASPSGDALPIAENPVYSSDDISRQIDAFRAERAAKAAELEAEKAKIREMVLSSGFDQETLTNLIGFLGKDQLSFLQQCISSRAESLREGASSEDISQRGSSSDETPQG